MLGFLKAMASKVGSFGSGIASRYRVAAHEAGLGLGAVGGAIGRVTGGIMGIGRTAIGPGMWGVATNMRTRGLLSGIGKRLIGPGIVAGGFGAIAANRNLIGGAYSMDSPNVAWGYTPGMSAPYNNTTMLFGDEPRITRNMSATGSIAFALHNQRKG